MSTEQGRPAGLLVALVGSHFYPPAKQVLARSAAGSRVILRPEPENPYDPQAIEVLGWFVELVPASQFAALAVDLEGTGVTVEDLQAAEVPMKLGHVAKTGGKPAAGGPGNAEVHEALQQAPQTASLEFGAGGPAVRVQ